MDELEGLKLSDLEESYSDWDRLRVQGDNDKLWDSVSYRKVNFNRDVFKALAKT